MDFLRQQNRRVSNEPLGGAPDILAGGKHVVVIGGGDTGFGLYRHFVPAGRAVGDAARDHAGSAGAREQGADLAELAVEDADLVEPG